MNTVFIDTSSSSAAVTASGNAGSFTCIFTPANKRHSAALISLIESAVSAAGFSVEETEAVICPQGPGSFTGLRLAYSAAKAICLKTHAEFYCIPVLDALNFRYRKTCEQVLSIIDAKRDRFYVKFFKNSERLKEDGTQEIFEPADISAKEAVKFLNLNERAVICGSGTEQFKEDIKGVNVNMENLFFIEEKLENLSQIMLDCFTLNKNIFKVSDYDGPLYIRKSDAEE
ncbi:tRNA (adenosine(37)-N6)-threonylcarbamoyltransferase complex dimerization subunit type 1 TsaB [Treponema pedis]|uniref:tRNA (Adenosine(37)-N6)-threonylcarbamoyltransferase complex dimerization subunit type 1 TsaB n=1 Tax=Treponema pedis TaxID=409322 RepID=A0A7S7AVN3_9SPIR|nr:tRNA (adenosine(37)-N6)-threonylcarbamoyltransferase complex dimerization subunit type 1 TsaB [Treponema pedis]QOW60007.1 tRNA (adenosine(37)-N6)-threonylcarbamoyltransferase complex dimerization subunit type 1 TsaB [Treponema pedis]